MKILKSSGNLKLISAFLIVLAGFFTFLLPAGSQLSEAENFGIALKLETSSADNWTKSTDYELFNITINNSNATLGLNEINITMPLEGDGNASFSVNISTISKSLAAWNCTNASMDTLGNVTVVRCNTTAGKQLQSGSFLSIWFSANAPSTAAEDMHNWNVTAYNASGSFTVSQNLTSGVDGQVPRFSDFSKNGTYFNDSVDLLFFVNVTDSSLDSSTFSMEVVNASNVSQVLGAVAGESCTLNSDISWNCTVAMGLSSIAEENLTFNMTVADEVGNSNETTYPDWFVHDSTSPAIVFDATSTQAGNRSQDYLVGNFTSTEINIDTITVYLYNETALVNTSTGSTSPFYLNFTGLAIEETYYLNATINDTSGNSGATASTMVVTLDTVTPLLTITFPENNSVYTTSVLNVSYQVTEAIGLDTCKYKIDGGSWEDYGCQNMSTETYAGQGDHNLTVFVNDTAGNSNSSLIFLTVDTSAPTITLLNPANGFWDADGDSISFQFRPDEPYSSLENCTLYMTYDNGTGWINTSFVGSPNNNVTNTIPLSGLTNSSNENGSYLWNVECYDVAGYSGSAAGNNALFIGDRPNIVIDDISWTESPTPYIGQEITVNVTVKNNGSGDVVNDTYVRIYFDDDSSPASGPLDSNNTEMVSAGDLQVGENYNISYKFIISASQGDYYILAQADFNDSEMIEQHDANFGFDDNSRTEHFSTLLNITIINVTQGTNNPGNPGPAENVTLQVLVLFDNGTGVSGLELANFTVRDSWENDSTPSYRLMANTTLGDFDSSNDAMGLYIFNYTVPDIQQSSTERYAEYDLHYLRVYSRENASGHDHYDTSPIDVSLYNMITPYLDIEVDQGISTLTLGTQILRDFDFCNDGTANIANGVRIDDSDTYSGIDIDGLSNIQKTLNSGTCDPQNNIAINGTVIASDKEIIINASYNYTYGLGTVFFWNAKIFNVDITNGTDGDDDDDDDDDDDSSPPPAYDCATNASCASNKWCKDFKCVALNCPTGYTASSHKCKLKSIYDVEVEDYEAAINVVQGSTGITNVTVLNNGNKDLTVMLEVTDLTVDGVTVNITPGSYSTQPDDLKNFTVTFTIEDNATIGNHTAKYKATTSSTATDTANFKLVIQPLAETIAKIEADYEAYTALINQLLADYEAIKGNLAGDNSTLMGARINATKRLFETAKAAMESQNYIQVSASLDELKTLVNQTRTFMEELGFSGGMSSEFWNTVMMWAVIGLVAVGAVGLLIYMFLPSQGYALGKGYAPGKSGFKDKFANSLLCAKNKVFGSPNKTTARAVAKRCSPAYVGGYKKISPYSPEQPGIGGKIKKVFKRN